MIEMKNLSKKSNRNKKRLANATKRVEQIERRKMPTIDRGAINKLNIKTKKQQHKVNEIFDAWLKGSNQGSNLTSSMGSLSLTKHQKRAALNKRRPLPPKRSNTGRKITSPRKNVRAVNTTFVKDCSTYVFESFLLIAEKRRSNNKLEKEDIPILINDINFIGFSGLKNNSTPPKGLSKKQCLQLTMKTVELLKDFFGTDDSSQNETQKTNRGLLPPLRKISFLRKYKILLDGYKAAKRSS
jgi:hypothetical protein